MREAESLSLQGSLEHSATLQGSIDLAIPQVLIALITNNLRTLGGHRRYPAAPLRDLAASLGYQPDSDDTDALEAMVAPVEDGPIFRDDLPADPRELPPDPRL